MPHGRRRFLKICMPCPSALSKNFLNMFKKFWMCWKVLDVFKKFLAMFKNFEHIFFFKFFPFLVILHHIQIFWTRPKNFEHVQNFLTTFKIFWSRSKILDGADGQGISRWTFDQIYKVGFLHFSTMKKEKIDFFSGFATS